MKIIIEEIEELEKTLYQVGHESIKPFCDFEQSRIKKSFPGDIDNRKKNTFLMNTKIKDRLYSYLLMYSYTETDKNSKEKYYVTSAENLPKWADMRRELGYNNKKTYNNHLTALEIAGYIQKIEIPKWDNSGTTTGYVFLKPTEEDNFFFEITNSTIRILLNTMRDNVFKAYLYIGRKFESNKTQFNYITLVEFGEHLGYTKDKNGKLNSKQQYQALQDILFILQGLKLINLCKAIEKCGRPQFNILDVTHDIYKPVKIKEI